MSLMQKTLLLIGPGEYFGAALVKAFSSAGYQITIITGREETIQKLQQATNIDIRYKIADITNAEELRAQTKKLCEKVKNITCLIYNPKMSPKGTGLEISQEVFGKTLSVNVGGLLTTVQEALPYLEEGSVLVTGGGYKDTPDPDKFALSVGKIALHGAYATLESVLKEKNVVMGTVIIDGAVREDSSITPDMVANAFLTMAEENKGGEVYIR